MSKEKDYIGFETPSKEILSAFEKIQSELKSKKVEWSTISASINQWLIQMANVKDRLEKEGHDLSSDGFIIMWNIIIASMIAKIGVELTDVHVRITGCERQINEMKRVIK